MKATIMPVFAARPFTFGAVDGETYYYVTDGNKNVTALLDADGVRVAKYTYNPFGRILNSEGALAEINPFRFSSEYHDDETGLVYYNYRYYSPELGRWTKRDPIEEKGGVNLYAMVGNNPINRLDDYGLIVIKRNNEEYGQACFENSKETIKDLADLTGLKENEASYWLKDKSMNAISKPQVGYWYFIPNTVIAYWGGDMGIAGKIYVNWPMHTSRWRIRGFKVVSHSVTPTSHFEYQNLLEATSRNGSLYGTYFWGHGNRYSIAAEFGFKMPDWLGTQPKYVDLLYYRSLNLAYAPAFAPLLHFVKN